MRLTTLLPLAFLAAARGAEAPAAPSLYDRLWAVPTFVTGGPGDFFQEIRLTGREQLDWYDFRENGVRQRDWVNRRTRLGLRAQFLEHFTFHTEADFNLEFQNPLYTKLTISFLQWSPSREFTLTVGKQPARFTLDGSTSSNELLAIDRSALTYNIGMIEETLPGISVNRELGEWSLRAGVFSGGTATPEYGKFDAGALGVLSVGHSFAHQLGVRRALLRLDYLLQENDPQNASGHPQALLRNHHQAASLNFHGEEGPWGLSIDLAASQGQGTQSDLSAWSLMPTYDLTPEWQLVFRYTHVDSAQPNGVALVRYENRLVSGMGDQYDEFYFGLNRYFYGHRLKWQLGCEHARMRDHAEDGGACDGWGVTSALRVSW